MAEIIFTYGLPGSGKTHWALSVLAERPGFYKRVSKDELREMLDGGRWSGENEAFVLDVRDQIIVQSLHGGKSVIVDDTNLHPRHRRRFEELAKGYRESSGKTCTVRVQDFSQVPVETCIERDLKRARCVGEKVIRRMWADFLAPEGPSLSDGNVVDIDGRPTIGKSGVRREQAIVAEEESTGARETGASAEAQRLGDLLRHERLQLERAIARQRAQEAREDTSFLGSACGGLEVGCDE